MVKCSLTKEQCDLLEELRIGLWNSTFNIEKNAQELSVKIKEIEKMVKRTEQENTYYMNELKGIERMANFLEPSMDTEKYLYDLDKKPYRKPGFYNNIIHDIEDNCDCRKYQK